jgi:hypothetical protein
VVDTVARVAASLNKTDRRALCCRHLANDWRMHMLFAKDHSVIVISLARHEKGHNPH